MCLFNYIIVNALNSIPKDNKDKKSTVSSFQNIGFDIDHFPGIGTSIASFYF